MLIFRQKEQKKKQKKVEILITMPLPTVTFTQLIKLITLSFFRLVLTIQKY